MVKASPRSGSVAPSKSILKTSDSSSSYRSSSRSSSSDRQTQVCFGDLVIYEFPNILGDHPACSDGAPLTIGWDPTSIENYNVQYYEYLRQSDNLPRRSRKQLTVDAGTRGTCLLQQGYTLKQILQVTEEMEVIQESRRQNMKKSNLETFKGIFMKNTSKLASKNKNKNQQQPKRGSVQPRILAAKSG
uniref:Uncharacterized protein n=1 Tax=Entomoneis paludosa TaxID=265537 RepID=A0A7S2V7E0_9STRA|eukprot:CAMPEP_0172456372 /NCGR_PEP_ID=MMETSP1065-20121228/15425_1 /TAXON_ID=265537 /ORGANISM="Amphiprora paludosa, Strain CCMP125" /LENGTH=187 /DNA_ID=CAMNT_0013209325 /DNA_START=31 /DNA_END=594 /DNA_ORIENTATION=-